MKSFTVSEEQGVVRADKFLAGLYPQYSRAAIAKLFEYDLVKKDSKSIKPGEKLKPGTLIEADISPLDQEPDVVELPILYEDNDVLVVDKPAGIISHSRGRYWQEPSVASFIRSHSKSALPQNGTPERSGIVHRLDRATSGVMITAKNERAMKFLQNQFQKRNVKKTYIALIESAPEKAEAIIDAAISRNPNDPKRFMVSAQGKSALTHYKTLTPTPSGVLLQLEPRTGRTHQLRLHLKYINRPIIGDEFYDGKPADRLFLHAASLKLKLPNGEDKTFTSKIPKAFYL
ncbi:RluA family pseudouridine synthase [Candidatus Saccharibacteria bacterium]|jgi:23S rRNA pseudouridine1911/1915/1917 synthase|nr:MAG: RluA family pseudouridine synthase [Candidatus Saccharibacteria bacterium]